LEQTRWQWPKLLPLWRYLRDYDPDVTIIREGTALTDLWLILFLMARRKRFLLYTQGAKFRRQHSWKRRWLARILVHWMGNGWFTPVLYRDGPQPCDLETIDFLPLIWTPAVPERKDWSDFQPGQPTRLLDVGKFARYKNHPLVIEAVARLREKFSLRLTVIGECSSDEHRQERMRCEKIVSDLGLKGCVQLRDNLAYEALHREYARHDLLILGSKNETFGMVVLEAMGYGLPPVTGNGNGCACYVEHGLTGFVFQSGNVNSLVSVLSDALTHRECLPVIGRRAMQTVAIKYSPEAYYTTLCKVVKTRLGIEL
jgi:glycosyltransferase involved in cell wall biosynthesis